MRTSLVDSMQRGPRREYDQFMTPLWAAEAMVADALEEVPKGRGVLDFGTGEGAFLASIPADYRAAGIEIDPLMAARSQTHSGRPVVVGDFRTCPLPFPPDVVVGNPPFARALVDALLRRIHPLLPSDGLACLLLPAAHFQVSRSVMSWHELYSIEQRFLPRDLFPNLSIPLCWAKFRRANTRTLVGFFLYESQAEVRDLSKDARLLLVRGREGRRGAWRAVASAALEQAGGEASLSAIYAFVEGRRPHHGNKHWKEQIRKVLRRCSDFIPTGEARYRLAA